MQTGPCPYGNAIWSSINSSCLPWICLPWIRQNLASTRLDIFQGDSDALADTDAHGRKGPPLSFELQL